MYQDKNERHSSREAGVVGIVIYTRKIGRCVEGEYDGKSKE